MIFRVNMAFVHLAFMANFVAMPLVVDAATGTTAIRINMCGHDHAIISIEVPVDPPPPNQKSCHKACHAGCFRKRKPNGNLT